MMTSQPLALSSFAAPTPLFAMPTISAFLRCSIVSIASEKDSPSASFGRSVVVTIYRKYGSRQNAQITVVNIAYIVAICEGGCPVSS